LVSIIGCPLALKIEPELVAIQPETRQKHNRYARCFIKYVLVQQ